MIFALSSMSGHPHQGPIGWQFYLERKGAHITEYFILTLLLFRLFRAKGFAKKKIIYFTISLALLWAFSDEFHQLFVFGREGKLSDVGIDSIGIILGILVATKIFARYGFLKNDKTMIVES